jgi:hypothetical protein
VSKDASEQSAGATPPARVESERDTGGIGRLLDEVPEDLPGRNEMAVIPAVIPGNVHEPNEAAVAATRDRKCACKPVSVELIVALLAGEIPSLLPVRRCLDEPRFQMRIAQTSVIRVDCVVRWHDSPFQEVAPHPIVPGVRNIFPVAAKS